jgi:ABC-type branched-subunit amino acid transport system ATPase component/ABC-type branched-subunit amino acid transport system permease subunit
MGLLALPLLTGLLGMPPSVASEIAIFALVGLGFNLLLGYTGLVSFGHGAYFGIAAYGVALFQLHLFPDSLLVPIALAILLCATLGPLVGFLVLRRRGVYFALLTLAFTALLYYVAFRWTAFTGGENGLGGFARPALLGLRIDDQLLFYWLVAGAAFLATWLLWRIVQSPFGRVLVAIRENEQRAEFLGYSVQRYKLMAFVISVTAAGLGGSLIALLKYFVSADLVHVNQSGEILAMSIIGGTRSFLGPAVGALFYVLFREILSAYTASWQFYFGLLFMGFILFSPTGLVGLWGRLRSPFQRQEETLAAMAARAAPSAAGGLPAFLRAKGPPADQPLLECRAVGKRFGSFTAVAAVDLQLRDRRLHALIGPNGAGKTTLFNVLSGMYPPDTGEFVFLGESIGGLGASSVVSRGLARSFQVTNLLPGLTVFENLRLSLQAGDPRRFNPWRPAGTLDEVNRETEELIAFLGLKGLERALAADLSYGGQRLLEIGLALGAKPKLLLLDEPLAGLSADERERVIALAKRLAEHMAVLMIEHDIDRVFAFADSITVMNEGRVLVSGTPEQVRHHPQVQEVYLGSGRPTHAFERPRAAAAGNEVLRLDAVNAYYGKSHILHDVSLTVGESEVVALVGRNGAGKSSTFKSIMGLNPPRRGEVRFLGRRITGRPPEEAARLGIGLVPQGRRLFPNLTVAENLQLGGLRRTRGSGAHWDLERIFQYFPQLRSLMWAKADVLSGGEQQMVAVARALTGHVRCLLLDEPFEGLAPQVKDEVARSIDRLRGEISILIVEHDLDQVLALADRVYVLDRGRITHEGPAGPLLHDLEFRKQVLWV